MMSGATLALVSAALFGASTPFAKLLLGAVDPWVLAGLLYLGSGLGLVAALAGRAALGLPKTEAPLRKTDLAWLGLIILFGGILGPVLLMLGLRSTPASSASLLLNLEGLATMAIAWIAVRRSAAVHGLPAVFFPRPPLPRPPSGPSPCSAPRGRRGCGGPPSSWGSPGGCP